MKRVLLGLVFLLLSSTEGWNGIRIVPRPLVCLGSPSYSWTIVKEWTDCIGTYIWMDGDEYVGEVKNGKQHGQGTYTFASGSKYVGGYKEGKKHGYGVYTWADGETKEGIWKNGRFLRQSHQNLHSFLRVKNQNRY